MKYRDFFKRAYGKSDDPTFGPYDYQSRLAEESWPNLLNVPTGTGKTAAVTLAWLYKRGWRQGDRGEEPAAGTPRRLIWCLPMRVLVEQTKDCVKEWLKQLGLRRHVKVHVLMGGEEAEDWDMYPEQEAVLIGTQDMMISRALNRGFGMSRSRWPMHFGLLNNDCLWVLDETQLMGSALSTTVQLHAFRESLGVFGSCRSLWMSATLNPKWLDTVDLEAKDLGAPLRLSDDDKGRSETYKAVKALKKADVAMGDSDALAEQILAAHQSGSRTLVIVNTVDRAVSLYNKIGDHAMKRKQAPERVLIHSRYRPQDRAEKVQRLRDDPSDEGTVIVSTQVVEAGVDISARVLFTELAPWASLVQRFGRCNRRGEYESDSPAQVYWIDLPPGREQQDGLARPYDPDALSASKRLLEQCDKGVGPQALEALDAEMEFKHGHVMRRKDLVELFDTTPDLSGNDIDIDRYVRDVESSDVHVFWRDLQEPPPPHEKMPQRDELCPAPIGDFRAFVGKLSRVGELRRSGIHTPFRRNFLERCWEPVRAEEIYPGQTYMLAAQAGGYDDKLGWNSGVQRVDVIPFQHERIQADDSNDADSYSQIGVWQPLSEHSTQAHTELEKLIDQLAHLHAFRKPLLTAIRWHDLGKAHWVFRHALPNEPPDCIPDPFEIYAKAKGKWKKYLRPRFRHELASALAVLQASGGLISDEYRNLIAYLVAAHHGKVRLSIRSLPGEKKPEDPKVRFARGVWDGDPLPETDLGGDVVAPAVSLSLEPMELGLSNSGRSSWAERMLALRDEPELGPFRLAYLESVLRAADMRVSAQIARKDK